MNALRLRRIQSGLLIAFTLLILLLLNISAWWMYLRVSRYLEGIFSRSMMESAELAALSASRMPNLGIAAPSENSLEYLEQQSFLLRLQEAGKFNDLFLVDPSFHNLVGIYPDFKIGRVDGLIALDRQYLEKALLGQTALTPTFVAEGLYLRTAYVPVYSPAQRLEAILVARADVEFLQPQIAIRNTLIAITALNGLGVLFLALAYGQSLKALRKIESRVAQNERLAGLGQLAAGVAHELRNPLGIIEQTMTVLRRRYETEPDELFDYIPDEVARMNRIISQFLDLSREAPVHVQPNDLVRILERTLALLEYRLGQQKVELQRSLPESLSIPVDADKMQQVFLNLFLNALDAMPEGGKLSIRMERHSDKNQCVLVIEDTGNGILPEHLPQVFDPFFTTRESGTGLGLSIARQMVTQHGGSLNLVSEPGRGTRVSIVLPLGKTN